MNRSTDKHQVMASNKLAQCFSVEGNIGSGKTTLLTSMQKTWSINCEPVDMWQTYEGINWIEQMYSDPHANLMQFQIIVLASFMKRWQDPIKRPTLMERSSLSVAIFSKHALLNGYLSHSQYTAMVTLTKNLTMVTPVDGIIYLRTTPENSYARMLERARSEESLITLSYLKQLHELHDLFLMGRDDVFVFDGDLELEQQSQEICRLEQWMVSRTSSLLNRLSTFDPAKFDSDQTFKITADKPVDRNDQILYYGKLSTYAQQSESDWLLKMRYIWLKRYDKVTDFKIAKLLKRASVTDPWLPQWTDWRKNDITSSMGSLLASLCKSFVDDTSAFFQNKELGKLLKSAVTAIHEYKIRPENQDNWYTTCYTYPSMLLSMYTDLQIVSSIYDSKWLYEFISDIELLIKTPTKAARQGKSKRTSYDSILLGTNLVYAKKILNHDIDWNHPDYDYFKKQLNIEFVKVGEGLYPDYSCVFHEKVRYYGYLYNSSYASEIMNMFIPNNYSQICNELENILGHPGIDNNNTSLWGRGIMVGRQIKGGVLGVQILNFSRIINVKKSRYFAQIIGPVRYLSYYESDVEPGNAHSAHYWLFYSEPMTPFVSRLYSPETCRYLRGVLHNGTQFKLAHNTPNNTYKWNSTDYSASTCATLGSCTAISKRYAITELNDYFNNNNWRADDQYTTKQQELTLNLITWSADIDTHNSWKNLHELALADDNTSDFTMFNNGNGIKLKPEYQFQFLLWEHHARVHTGITDICFDEGIYSIYVSTEPYKTIQEKLWITLETGILIYHNIVRINGIDVARFEFENKVLYVLHGQYATMNVVNKFKDSDGTEKFITETTVQAKPYAMHLKQSQKPDSVIAICMWVSLVEKTYDISSDNIQISIEFQQKYVQDLLTISIRNYTIITQSALVILEKIDGDHYNGVIIDSLDEYHDNHYVTCLGQTRLMEKYFNDKFYLDFRETQIPFKWSFDNLYDNEIVRSRLIWTPDPLHTPLQFKLYRGTRAWTGEGLVDAITKDGCFMLNDDGSIGKPFVFPGFSQGIDDVIEFNTWQEWRNNIHLAYNKSSNNAYEPKLKTFAGTINSM
ncbi:unnamed protein product [Ceutorhynchus assimilis]|uniref:Deoxynucleoside kinase domain-containing protein n=1 Tax=Ceutorhynchus assimilis TaxID=467358 RepID=A0A9N9MZ25_9CUCU|nr:unnamed protein product [Ceutorhynchus assimilis]